MRRASILLALVIAAPAQAQLTYSDPGTLQSPGGGALRPGAGRVDFEVYAPGIRFPIEVAPAYLNSQIYGNGGYMGPGGSLCDAVNYAYPWHDNYCEERSWDMPMCPSGQGHQGQDIRASTCANDTHWAVAATDGTITNIGSYSVYLTADDGRRYDYLHMRSVQVAVGQRVARGQHLGRVSNNFGGTATSVHLHFNIRMNVSGYGNVYAPTYMSLIRSYEGLVGPLPWSAAFVAQSFPFASRPFELTPGQEVDGYIEMRNIGGSTWEPGKTFLGTTEPRDVASPIAAPSWVGPNRAATIDRVVPPGESGRFNFRVRAPTDLGDYPQFFNLVQEGVAWFSSPPDDQLQIRVTVVPAPPPVDADADGHDATIDCNDADASVHPGATETCGDANDQDCDGADLACAAEDAAPPPIDAGNSTIDAGTTIVPPEEPTLSGNCGCRATGNSGAGAAWLAVVSLMLAIVRRRSR